MDYDTNEDDLKDFFADEDLNPTNIKLMIDRESGRSKGFAFVSFASKDECEKAMGLDGAGLGRRTLKINFVN